MSYLISPNTVQRTSDYVNNQGRTTKREPQKTGRTYGTSNLTYPLEMGIDAPAELDNHIIFDIYFDESTSFQLSGTPDEPRAWKTGNLASVNLANAIEQGAQDLGRGIDRLMGAKTPDLVKSAVNAGGKALKGAFGGATNLKKLNSSIALAVPNTLTQTSTANYSEAKMGAITGAVSRALTGNMGNEDTATLAGQGARLAAEVATQLPDAFGMNLQNILEVSTRRVSNPHIEQRFESISFREFSFVYDMAAKSEAEAVAIDNIIKTFRFHMHPELIESGLFYDYPSLFDITLMFRDRENDFLQKISTCYLTSFTTNFTSSGVFSTLRNGMPTEVQITMNFREIEPMHKKRISEGY